MTTGKASSSSSSSSSSSPSRRRLVGERRGQFRNPPSSIRREHRTWRARPAAMASLYLLLATSSSLLLLCSASTVLDLTGDPVRFGATYSIKKGGINFFGGVAPSSRNGSSCARYAAFSLSEADPGVPVRFHPFQSGDTLQTGHGSRFKIEFTSIPSCVGSGKWNVDEDGYVVIGGDASYFAVLPPEEGGEYTLGYCGPCGPCKNGCLPVAFEGPFLKLGEDPLLVNFLLRSDGAPHKYVL